MDGSAKQQQSLRDGLLARQSVPPRLIDGPAPSQAEIDDMLMAAVCAPDHGAIRPWRFHVIQGDALNRLGDIFVEALKKREPDAPRAKIVEVDVAIVVALHHDDLHPRHDRAGRIRAVG